MAAICFFVEGNIAAGKSTFLEGIGPLIEGLLGRRCVVVKEPVDAWVAPLCQGGDGILQLFYQDKPRHAVAFQATVLISRLAQLLKIMRDNPGCIIIAERSPSSGQMFAHQMHDEGVIDPTMCVLHEKWVAMAESVIGTSGTIYLRVSPDVCMQRLHKRGRSGEDGIPCKLLSDLHEIHDAHVSGLVARGHPVLTLDGNLEIMQGHIVQEHVESLAAFVRKIVA